MHWCLAISIYLAIMLAFLYSSQSPSVCGPERRATVLLNSVHHGSADDSSSELPGWTEAGTHRALYVL